MSILGKDLIGNVPRWRIIPILLLTLDVKKTIILYNINIIFRFIYKIKIIKYNTLLFLTYIHVFIKVFAGKLGKEGQQMSISLFEHNEKAYQALAALLARKGRGAIIHPTGTGKSFIAFKLCAEHPQKQCLWLAPSEHIFQLQQENLRHAGAEVPPNIKFLTYAKLTYLEEAEIAALAADYIILDEFHRCGARVWGQGVAALLASHKQAQVVGLSATPIRYLDQQRDVAEELFGGNIASEMTLGEALVRGILQPPKYVLSAFAYQKDLQLYERRVQQAKNKAVRKVAAEYLEALRSALAQAEGLDQVFAKHVPDKQGKYLVFCANVEHLHEMQEVAASWFHLVDDRPHCYAAYAENPKTEAALEAFKQDSSPHIKLLFCVDMFNEGVHVADVDGVILLRPTVSPIIYKQQIGRALSTSRQKQAVIFDIVLNIENLYSIGAVEDEMQLTLATYREQGRSQEIVHDHFQVIAEVRNCLELFQGLQTSLTASWELMYAAAAEYYGLHGDLQVPKLYRTREGYSLGMWLYTQRRIYQGRGHGSLTPEQIVQLEDIGMEWLPSHEVTWQRYFKAAKAYAAEQQHLLVPATEVYQGVKLGAWLTQLRVARKKGTKRTVLTAAKIKALDDLGMVWDVSEYLWDRNYEEAKAYYQEHGDLEVPRYYITPHNIRLGTWLTSLRHAYNKLDQEPGTLTETRIKALEAIGMVWQQRRSLQWDKYYEEALNYYRAHGDLKMPVTYTTADGCRLGRWLRLQRDRQSKLSQEKQAKLAALGMEWQDGWSRKFYLLEAYYQEHGNLAVPIDYRVDGIWLGHWLRSQQEKLQGGQQGTSLTSWQKEKLLAIGLGRLTSRAAWLWEEQFTEVEAFAKEQGHLQIPSSYVGGNGKKPSLWLQKQREKYAQGKLEADYVRRLTELGMVWEQRSPWEMGLVHAQEYYRQQGNLLVEQGYTSPDGYSLGNWIYNQRAAYKKKNGLTPDKIASLEKLGMVWSMADYRWLQSYALAAQYEREHGHVQIPSNYCTKEGYHLGRWLRQQKERLATLTEPQLEKLGSLGVQVAQRVEL